MNWYEKNIKTYENEICEVNSNRVQFRQFKKPFKAILREKYIRWNGTKPAYKVECPNRKVYCVYSSEIMLDENKNENIVHESKKDTSAMDEYTSLYERLKIEVMMLDKSALDKMLNVFNNVIKQTGKSSAQALFIEPYKLIVEMAIELRFS